MTEDELKQWTELTAKFEDKDKEIVTTIIKEKAHAVFQDINDGGRSAANKDNGTKLTELQTSLTTTTEAKDKAEKALKEIEGKTPDVAKLRQTYEDDLKKVNEDFGKKEVELKGQLGRERHKNAVRQLVDALVRNHEIDREYAETILAKRDDINERISVDESGKITVYKDGTTDLPLVSPNAETTVIELFAKQLGERVDPKWKTSKVKKGSQTKGSGGDVTVDNESDEFDDIRKEQDERNKAGSARNASHKSGFDRLAGRR